MPHSGFKSLTIKDTFYDTMLIHYKNLKQTNNLPDGIHSFTGYIEHKLSSYLKERESLINLANQIKSDGIPEKFLTDVTVIKPIYLPNE